MNHLKYDRLTHIPGESTISHCRQRLATVFQFARSVSGCKRFASCLFPSWSRLKRGQVYGFAMTHLAYGSEGGDV